MNPLLRPECSATALSSLSPVIVQVKTLPQDYAELGISSEPLQSLSTAG